MIITQHRQRVPFASKTTCLSYLAHKIVISSFLIKKKRKYNEASELYFVIFSMKRFYTKYIPVTMACSSKLKGRKSLSKENT